MLLLLAVSTAFAVAPDRVAAAITTDASNAWDLVPGPDGLSLLFADGSTGAIGLLDLRTWEVTLTDACSGASGIGIWEGSDQTRVYTGCSDGTVVWLELDDGALGSASDAIDIEDGGVLSVVVADDMVYVLTDPDDGANPRLHTVDPDTDAVDGSSGFPVTTSASGFQDMEAGGSLVFVLHGNDNLSKIATAGGGLTSEQNSLGVLDAVDLVVSSSGTSVLAGGGAAVARYGLGDNDWTLSIGSAHGVEDVHSIGLMEDEGLLLVADADTEEIIAYPWDSTSGGVGNTEEDRFSWPSSGATLLEMAPVLDDYMVMGTGTGQLWVATARPWVEVDSVSPTAVGEGSVVTLTFHADTAGDYEVRLNGDDNDDGDVLLEGSVEADASETVEITVDDSYIEGDNHLRVVVTDSSGLSGHDAAVVEIDNPPAAISLSQSSVGVAENYLKLSFTAPDDEDLATVTVYVSTVPFSADDWSSGGPAFEGDDDLDAPISLSVDPSEEVEAVISPLTNGTTYYLAVRATDSGGLEGPMSTVVSGTPENTLGVAELAGEDGGFCGLPGAASGMLAGIGGLLALGRRRRRFATAGAALLLLGLSPGMAQAQDGLDDALSDDTLSDDTATDDTASDDTATDDTTVVVSTVTAVDVTTVEAAEEPPPLPTVEELIAHQPDDKVRGGVTLRFGPMWFDDSNPVTSVLGSSGHNILWLEGGPSWFSIIQLSGGIGYYRKKGTLVTASGSTSDQDDLLYAVPVTANLTLRLDFLEEQFLVPYGTAGGDFWFWRESWEVDGDGNRSGIGGGKAGYHYGVGGQILLDIFERSRADTAKARLGIQDTYLTVEWRHQEIGLFDEGIDLSNDQLSFGLKLNY